MKAGTETVDFKSRPRYDIAVKTVRVFTIRAMAAMIDDMRRNLGFGQKYQERDLDDWRVMGIDRGARFMAIRVDTFNGEIFVKFMTWLHELPEDGGDSYAPGANLNDCDKTIGVVELDPRDYISMVQVHRLESTAKPRFSQAVLAFARRLLNHE
jgi:hypothetical protein